MVGDQALDAKVDDLDPLFGAIGAVLRGTLQCVGWFLEQFVTWNGIVELAVLAVVASVVMKVMPLWQHRTRIDEVTTTKFIEKVADKRATGKAAAANDAQALIRQCILLVVACGAFVALIVT